MYDEKVIQSAMARGARFYYEMLEFPVNAAAGTITQIQILNQELLTGARILDLEVYSSDDMAVTPLNNPLFAVADLQGGYFQGYASDPTKPFIPNSQTDNNAGLWLSPVPLIAMHRVQTGTDAFVRQGFPLAGYSTIFWGKSKFIFPAGFTVGSGTKSLLMGVSYLLYPDNTTN